jgi:hypothetical protein
MANPTGGYMADAGLPLDELVAIYIKIRDAIDVMEEEHKQKLEVLKEQQQLVIDRLLELCNEQNMDSIRTPMGTVSRRVSARYWTSDWDSMYQFIKEHDAPYLLEQRIHNSNMRAFLEDHPENFPLGLQAERKYVIQVRKPRS